MSINALIAQGGTPIGADVPQIFNMLQQRAQQTLQNNRLATQDQYAADEHAHQTEQYKQEKENNDAKQAYGESSQLLQIQEPGQFLAAVQQAPHILTALQQHNIDPSNPDAVRQAIQNVNHMTAAHLGIGPPKPVEISAGAKLFAPPDPSDPNAGYRELASNVKPDEITAYQKEALALTRRGQDLTNARAKSGEAGSSAPSGYRWNADKTGMEVIPGGPADKTGGLGGREGVMFQRVASSAKAGLQDLKNIAELPVGASTGFLGVGASPGHSVMASARDVLRNKLSGQDVQDYNTMIAGLSRNLSTIETAGLAPNGSITASMDSIMLREGDSGITKLRKLAQARQIIIRGIETNLANPKLPKEQKAVVQQIMDDTAAAIPFTQHDITEMQKQQNKNPSITLMDVAGKKGLGKSAAHPSDIQSILDKYPAHEYAGPG